MSELGARKDSFIIRTAAKTTEEVVGVVTQYFGVHKEVVKFGVHKDTPWVLTHLGTGYAVGRYPAQKNAKKIAVELEQKIGRALDTADVSVATSALRPYMEYIRSWGNESLDDFMAELTSHEKEAVAAKQLAAKLEGRTVHWIGGSYYGLTASLHDVEVVNDKWIRCSLRWKGTGSSMHSPGSSVLGARVYLDDIVEGSAPNNMPWERFSSTWIAKLSGWRYNIGRVGDLSFLVWNEHPAGPHRISQFATEERFPTLDTAKRFAQKHATGVSVESARRYALQV